MYDPWTHVAEINIPFTGKKNKQGAYIEYPKTLIDIWHVDPEKDGTDDSCDWFGRKMPHDLQEKAEKLGREEWEYYFGPEFGDRRFSTDLEIVFAVWSAVDWRIGEKRRIRSLGELREIFYLACNPGDNLSRSIMEAKTSREGMAHLFYIVFSNYRRYMRPWYKHPRFHFWHYKIRFVPIQLFKRWAFSKCQGCGKRFRYGESPVSTQWESDGPRWFKSERNIYHSGCVPHPVAVNKEVKAE